MSGRRKSGRTLGEHAIFGDEEAAALQAEIAALRELVNELALQVHAQFTTISAHAEIARQQADFAREEARADLDRTRTMMIELVERTRIDLAPSAGIHIPGAPPGPSVSGMSDRLETVEAQVIEMVSTVDRCFDRQRVLADTMEALIDSVVAERRGEPVAGLSLV